MSAEEDVEEDTFIEEKNLVFFPWDTTSKKFHINPKSINVV